MPLYRIRILSAALAMVFILAGLVLPGWARGRNEQNTEFPFFTPYKFPDKTAPEQVQMGKDMLECKKIRARIKAGERVECGGLTATILPIVFRRAQPEIWPIIKVT